MSIRFNRLGTARHPWLAWALLLGGIATLLLLMVSFIGEAGLTLKSHDGRSHLSVYVAFERLVFSHVAHEQWTKALSTFQFARWSGFAYPGRAGANPLFGPYHINNAQTIFALPLSWLAVGFIAYPAIVLLKQSPRVA